MKNLLCIVLFIPLALVGQSQDPCYSINEVFNQIDNENPPIEINLLSGWNMIGFPCSEDAILTDVLDSIIDKVVIVKDNNGSVFIPEYGFNGIGFLEAGHGYQVKMNEFVLGFTFCESIGFPIIDGCTDCAAFNFDKIATNNDNSCIYDSDGDGVSDADELIGCQDSSACNYDELATDNGECLYVDDGLDCADYYYEIRDSGFLSFLEDQELIVHECYLDVVSANNEYDLIISDGGDYNIKNIDGIQFFRNLKYLGVFHADNLTTIQHLSSLTNLTELHINNNPNLTSIPDLSSLTNLNFLSISSSPNLTSIPDLSSLTNLSGLTIAYFPNLTSMPDLSSLTNLHTLSIFFNPNLTSIPNLSSLTNLTSLTIENNYDSICVEGFPEQFLNELDNFPPVCQIGCADSLACNYDSNHLYDDGSCEYPSQGYDCEGNEITTYEIGDLTQGGIIFYVDETGQHGLVAATEDLTEGATDPWGWGFNGYEWGCYGEGVNGADRSSIGTGYQNTLDIVNQGCTSGNEGVTAAQATLDVEISGYSDWYLPSKDELLEIYNTVGWSTEYSNLSGFWGPCHFISDCPYIPNLYWSSTGYSQYSAWVVDFDDGYPSTLNTNDYLGKVRPIRSF